MLLRLRRMRTIGKYLQVKGERNKNTLQRPVVVASSTFAMHFWPLQFISEVATCIRVEIVASRKIECGTIASGTLVSEKYKR